MLRYFICLMGFCILLCLAHCSWRNDTTYASLRPETKYVGNATCKSCHARIFEDYQLTGMGHSFYPPSPAQQIEIFPKNAAVKDGFSGFSYLPFWKGDSMYMVEFRLNGTDTTYKRTERVDYVVGSGNQTRSYLMERNGYLYEMPITWYVAKQIWDLSPGYEKGKNSRFSREIGLECMACHTGNFEFEEGSKNRFAKIDRGIDCERCHGPGSQHVKKMEAGEEVDVGKLVDYSIVNPEKLSIDLQFDVCQQCHLQGTNVLKKGKTVRDFRPAMPLKEVYAIFVEKNTREEEFGIASHADRLKQSQCFVQAKGKLTCTTCHNPHKSVHKTDKKSYNLQCSTCHGGEMQHEIGSRKLCTAPESAKILVQNDCVSCHMPKGGTNDIPHVSFHDHKIRVVKTQTTVQEIVEQQAVLDLLCANANCTTEEEGAAYLQYYETQMPHPTYLEKAANQLSKNQFYEQARLAYYKKSYPEAKKWIEQAMKAESKNPYYVFLAGEIAEAQQDFSEANQHYQKSYELQPNSIAAGLKAATSRLEAKKGDASVLVEVQKRLEVLLKAQPFDAKLLANYGFVLMNQQKYSDAERYFLRALHYEPDYRVVLENLVALYTAKGDLSQADKYKAKLNETKK